MYNTYCVTEFKLRQSPNIYNNIYLKLLNWTKDAKYNLYSNC